MRSKIAVALMLPGLTLLNGCGLDNTADSEPTTSRSTTRSTQIGASASTTWDAYLNVSSRALSDPDVDVQAIRPYVTASEFEAVRSQLADFRKMGNRLQGKLESRNFAVQTSSSSAVVALVCVDNRASKILDSKGEEVEDSRAPSYTLRLSFIREGGILRIDEDRKWNKLSVC